MANNSFFDSEVLRDIQKIYRESRDVYDSDSEKYWESLSYEDKLKAFYIITKRIHKGDVIDRGSFRYVLYEIFNFDMDSYLVGMDSGYMEIHNAIAEGLSDDEPTNGSQDK
jgi:hypothetical protein